MKLTIVCGLSVFPAQAERATMLVPPPQLPTRGMTDQNTKHVMTSTSQVAPDQCAISHTNVTDASSLVTTKKSVLDHKSQDHPHWHQLKESMFQPVTPVQLDKLKQLLIGHPNHDLVNKVVQVSSFGRAL